MADFSVYMRLPRLLAETLLGHVTMKGTPAIQTTVRYTQVSRSHVKEKLRLLKG